MRPKTILFIISLVVLIIGILPLIKQLIPPVIPTEGIIYSAALIIVGLIGLVSSMTNRMI